MSSVESSMTRTGALAAVAALVVAAGVGVIATGNDPSERPSEVLESDRLPPIQDCGTYEASYERPEDDGYRCAAAAFAAGLAARLEVTRQTDEGHPVVFTYETDGHVVRVAEDRSRDLMSPSGIGRKVCGEWTIDPVAGEVEPQDCSPEQPG